MPHPKKKTHTLVFVEGDTECLFYDRVKNQFHKAIPLSIINLGGNWNINKKILNETETYKVCNPDRKFRVFIAIDRESRHGLAQVDLQALKLQLKAMDISNKDVQLFEAVQDIESWFFHDVNGIFQFLRLHKVHRIPSKYTPVEKLNNRDLSKLFALAKKVYRKGFGSKNFIDKLNLSLIYSNTPTLQEYCRQMNLK